MATKEISIGSVGPFLYDSDDDFADITVDGGIKYTFPRSNPSGSKALGRNGSGDLTWLSVTGGGDLSAGLYSEKTIASTLLESGDSFIEVINVTVSGGMASDLTQITGASAGYIKILIIADGFVTVKHNITKIILTEGEDLEMAEGDILALVNIGGVIDSTDGLWRELFKSYSRRILLEG